MGLVHKLTLENAGVLVKPTDSLYIAVRPFTGIFQQCYDGEMSAAKLKKVKFTQISIESSLINLQAPALILQDASLVDLAVTYMSELKPKDCRYFVSTYNGSINPKDNIGSLEGYIRQFKATSLTLLGSQEFEIEQLRQWFDFTLKDILKTKCHQWNYSSA